MAGGPRILFVTDLHGNRDRYRLVEELAVREAVAAVVSGGDFLPGGRNLARTQAEFHAECFVPHLRALEAAGIGYLGMPGNDDLKVHDGLFRDACAQVSTARSIQREKAELEGYEFIGFDLVADYPFRLKDRCRLDAEGFQIPPQRGTGLLSVPEGFQVIPDWPARAASLPTLEDELARLPKPKDPTRAVYVIHMPPAGVGLDRCGDGREVGSRAVHRFIRKAQPRLTLHGHIHESPEETGIWCTRIGRTVSIQPGSSEDFIGVLIDLQTLAAVRKNRPARKPGLLSA